MCGCRYPLYAETFPPESEPSAVSLISPTSLTPPTADTPIDFADIVIKSRNRKRKGVWKNKTVYTGSTGHFFRLRYYLKVP